MYLFCIHLKHLDSFDSWLSKMLFLLYFCTHLSYNYLLIVSDKGFICNHYIANRFFPDTVHKCNASSLSNPSDNQVHELAYPSVEPGITSSSAGQVTGLCEFFARINPGSSIVWLSSLQSKGVVHASDKQNHPRTYSTTLLIRGLSS